jgi:uncharacterized protein
LDKQNEGMAMRLDDLDPSDNVRDHGSGGGGFGGGGIGGGGLFSLLIGVLPLLLGRKMGCGTVAIIGIIGYFVLSSGMLNLGGSGMVSEPASQSSSAGGNVGCDTEEELFACRVLKSTENTWGRLFAGAGQQYPAARLNFYNRGANSDCGSAQSAMGPFYCPADKGVYLDTSFFAQMKQQMGAGGDFAYAYVVSHEVGHHIQHVTGIAEKVRNLQSRVSKAEGNALQVRMELQADCYAGFWAGQNKDRFEPGDIEEGMRAANAIGDDTIMRNAGQRPVESMFTHGTSEQRMAALQRGMQSTQPSQCNYFQGIF